MPMLEFLRTGKMPKDPQTLLEQIAARYPERDKRLRIFVAAVYDNRVLVQKCIEHTFEELSARPPSSST